jgi:hypothetical protein
VNLALSVVMQAAQSTRAYTPVKQRSSPAIVLSLFVIVLAALGFGAWTYLLNQKEDPAPASSLRMHPSRAAATRR